MPSKNQIKPIRIGIDARFFGPKQKGLGRYVQKLVEGLEKTDTQNQYVIFLRKDNWHDFKPRSPNFKKVLADYRWYTLKEQVYMPFKIWQQHVDLMHFPHFNLPLFYLSPYIVTIHDLVLKRFPTQRATTLGPFRYWLKNLGYRIVIYSAVKRAKKIVAVSQFTKQDIVNHFRIDPGKIDVIYEGGPENIRQQSLPMTAQLAAARELQLEKPYLLYVGNAFPHKNLGRLISAFAKLISMKQTKHKHKDLQLVLVGELDYFYRRLKNLAHFSLPDIRNRIIFTGFVSDEDLDILYANADAYIFPSMCEGFGLPPLEAMAYGCPVLSSEATCLPEILGSAAIYFNPLKIGEMATKIQQVLEDRPLRKKMISRGYQQAIGYRWSEMAARTAALYSRI